MNKNQKKDENKIMQERRKYKRINKNFILSYYEKTDPNKKYEITQLKNISMGGICFITTRAFKPAVEIGVELKTPYLSETTFLEGNILESHEKVKGMLYETRVQFSPLSKEGEFLIAKLIDFFMKDTHENNT